MADEVVWLSYSALAEQLGISRGGARIKAVRAQWTRAQDPAANDGGVLVAVPKAVLDAASARRSADDRHPGVPRRRKQTKNGVSPRSGVNGGADTGVVTELAAVRARLEAVEQERDRLRQDHADELARLTAAHEADRRDLRADRDRLLALLDEQAAALRALATAPPATPTSSPDGRPPTVLDTIRAWAARRLGGRLQ